MPTSADPPAPTLEQLAAMLEAAIEVKAFRTKDGRRSRIDILIDNEALAASGESTYATGAQILAGLREALARLRYIDSVTEQYRNPDIKGATAADCQSFINLELKNLPYDNSLQTIMRRRMLNTTLQKLVELGMWRAAIDSERFTRQREAEEQRKAEQAKRDEEIRRQQAETEKRWKEAADKHRRESAAGSDRNSKSRQGYQYDKEAFRKAWEETFRGEFNDAFYGGFGRGFYGDTRSEEPPPKARNKDRAPWYTVLEVSVTANADEINKAYRRLAAKYHPDRCSDADAGQKMADINTARDEGLRGLS